MSYIRYELQMEGLDGNWRRVTSTRNPDERAALSEMMDSYRVLYPDLRWLLPAELSPHGRKLRLAKCTVEIIGEVNPKTSVLTV